MTAHETLWRSAESLLSASCGPPLALAVPRSASSSRYLVEASDLVLLRVGAADGCSWTFEFGLGFQSLLFCLPASCGCI